MINQEFYEELKKDFLSRDYGNISFDHPQYIEHERAYKDELIGIFRDELRDALMSLSENLETRTAVAAKAIDVFFRKLEANAGKPQNLVGFRYTNFLKTISAESKPEFAVYLSELLYGEGAIENRIDHFLGFLENVSSDPKYPYSSACGRAIYSFYLFLSDPEKHMFIRTQDLHNCLKQLAEQGLDGKPSGEEYQRIMAVVAEVSESLNSDGWSPRDLADIYTFLWLPFGDPQGDSTPFDPNSAFEYLDERYGLYRPPTKKIAAFETDSAKQLALEREGQTVTLYLETYPTGVDGIKLLKAYAAGEGRNSNLLSQAPKLAAGNTAVSVRVSSRQALAQLCDVYDNNATTAPKAIGDNMTIPLNTIMYGPPGTGKTYHTVNRALEILDPAYLAAHLNDRIALKQRFDQLKAQERIAMVTFHQSFSYEDFVEGLRADTDEEGSIHYRVRDGVFKRLCNRETEASSRELDKAIQDLQEKTLDAPVELKTATGKAFAVTYSGGSTFSINPASSADDKYYPASIEHLRRLYLHGESDGMYNPSYVKGILEHLKTEYDLSAPTDVTDIGPSVLIIDEINRGNVASIFGELITLLEASKRRGNDEALEVILPYSGDTLSVPADLYVVGTMNTADRSLATLDTALRRRFEFQAMYPEPGLLAGVVVEGVNIQALLTCLNQRIAILYDREHLIGHSFFMSLSSSSTIYDLKRIFERHILPTLEEYFFEDWNRIRQILGDHLKQSEPAFLIRQFTAGDIEKVLGNDLSEEVGDDFFVRNTDALNDPSAYIGIYSNAALGMTDA